MVERIGSGISRMEDLMSRANLPKPEYSMEGMFTVTFQRPLENFGETSERILNIIEKEPQITIRELSERLQKTTRSVEMQLRKLSSENKILRVGPDKGGYWQIQKL
jgi:ATP-dependent DNA helicase RecG